MGTDDPQIPDDGESPPQVVTLTKDYYIDKERELRCFIFKLPKLLRGSLIIPSYDFQIIGIFVPEFENLGI